MPEFPPVTIITFPDRSGMSSTLNVDFGGYASLKNLINAPKTPIVDSFLAKTPSVLFVRLNGGGGRSRYDGLLSTEPEQTLNWCQDEKNVSCTIGHKQKSDHALAQWRVLGVSDTLRQCRFDVDKNPVFYLRNTNIYGVKFS